MRMLLLFGKKNILISIMMFLLSTQGWAYECSVAGVVYHKKTSIPLRDVQLSLKYKLDCNSEEEFTQVSDEQGRFTFNININNPIRSKIIVDDGLYHFFEQQYTVDKVAANEFQANIIIELENKRNNNARDIYVSSSIGNDANNGITPTTPLKTLRRLSQIKLNPGDIVHFLCADKFYGTLIVQSGTKEGYIEYTSYSLDGHSQEMPQLRGSVIVEPDRWQYISNNLWAAEKRSPESEDLLKDCNNSFDQIYELSAKRDTDCSSHRIDKWDLFIDNEKPIIGCWSQETNISGQANVCKIEISSNDAKENVHSDIQLFSTNRFSIVDGEFYVLTFDAKTNRKSLMIDEVLVNKDNPNWEKKMVSRSANRPIITKDWDTYRIPFQGRAISPGTVNLEDNDNTLMQIADDCRVSFAMGSLKAGDIVYFDNVQLKKINYDDVLYTDIGNIIIEDPLNPLLQCLVKKLEKVDLLNQGDYFYDLNTKELFLYSHSNPAEFYKGDMHAALLKNIVEGGSFMGNIGKSYYLINGIDIRFGGAHGVYGNNNHHVSIKNCRISYVGGCLLPYGDNFCPINTVRYGNGVEFWDSASYIVVANNVITNNYDADVTVQEDGKSGFLFKTIGNETYNYSLIENIYIYNNILAGSEYNFEAWGKNPNSSIKNVYFVNNTCLNPGYAWGHSQRFKRGLPPDPSGIHVNFWDSSCEIENMNIKGNIFYRAKESALRFDNKMNDIDQLFINNNCYYSDDLDNVVIKLIKENGVHPCYTYNEFSSYQWNNSYSFDNTSIMANPQFEDRVYLHDAIHLAQDSTCFRLKENSPCRGNAGELISIKKDINSDLRHFNSKKSDIGADEFPTKVMNGWVSHSQFYDNMNDDLFLRMVLSDEAYSKTNNCSAGQSYIATGNNDKWLTDTDGLDGARMINGLTVYHEWKKEPDTTKKDSLNDIKNKIRNKYSGSEYNNKVVGLLVNRTISQYDFLTFTERNTLMEKINSNCTETKYNEIMEFLGIRKQCLEFVSTLVDDAGGKRRGYHSGIGNVESIDNGLPGMGLYYWQNPYKSHSRFCYDIYFRNGILVKALILESNNSSNNWTNPQGEIPWERIAQLKIIDRATIDKQNCYFVSFSDPTSNLTQTQVSQLYVSLFGRASEGDGNSYWQNDPASTTMTSTANVMLNTSAAKTYFGSTLNNFRDFIEHIYLNTLGKSYAEDPIGINYWVSELSGGKSKGEVVSALIVAAQHPDNAGAAQGQFNNKVEVSNYCADTVTDYSSLDSFTDFISDVTDDTATVMDAKDLIDNRS